MKDGSRMPVIGSCIEGMGGDSGKRGEREAHGPGVAELKGRAKSQELPVRDILWGWAEAW
jgi:hypothetical protein